MQEVCSLSAKVAMQTQNKVLKKSLKSLQKVFNFGKNIFEQSLKKVFILLLLRRPGSSKLKLAALLLSILRHPASGHVAGAWPADWLAGLLAGWPAGRPAGWLAGCWPHVWKAGWLAFRLACWLAGRPVGWPAGCLAGWLAG